MTEQEWLESGDPRPMVAFLRGKASERKLRLFAAACCRRVWSHLNGGELSQQAVEIAERYADFEATEEDLDLARTLVLSRCELYPGEPVYDPAYWSCVRVMARDVAACAFYAVAHAAFVVEWAASDYDVRAEEVRMKERVTQGALLREVAGNPFRPPRAEPGWLLPPVGSLAEAAYEHRQLPGGHLDTNRLLVLADALEERGCNDPDVLTHLRASGPHVRGCWALDLILGRE